MKQLNWYQIFGNTHTIPDGRTVTPTDDIQTLLHCANIWDKSYTTLAEVLADDDTLFLICISDNAIDYLVRSTTWAGVNLVPTMTGSTTPSGEASASAAYDSNTQGWRAFDGNASMPWVVASPTRTGWVRYKFASPVVVSGFSIQNRDENTTWICSPASFSLQGSNDGNSWTTLGSFTNSDNTRAYKATYATDNTTAYQYYRLNITDVLQSGGGISVGELQLYSEGITISESAMQYIGASDYACNTLLSDSTWAMAILDSSYKDYVLNDRVPVMTSDTTPSGVASASTVYSSTYPAWKAFNRTNDGVDDCWHSNGVAPQWLGYQFVNAVKVSLVSMTSRNQSNNGVMPEDFKIQGSDDGNTWTDLGSYTWTHGLTGNATDSYFVSNSNSYKYYRMYGETCVVSGAKMNMAKLQFFGRIPAGVQSWLKAGGVNKKYTTVSEVLSDLTTLATLMASSDAIDYLVTAKGWATEICSDSNAMADIGMNNYAANTLLADETWREAICNSTYFESVLNVKNPNMTDNTHPYGEASATTVFDSTYPAWKAFDGNNDSAWASVSGGVNQRLMYQFASAQRIYLVKMKVYYGSGLRVKQFTVKASNDGNTFDTLKSLTTLPNTTATDYQYTINPEMPYLYYALDNMESYAYTVSLYELQFYGRKDI